ncbi:glycosyltransferase family 2 protein [Geodermatophilus tzadiensis]|uniref:glycosyltransferase family 2 protein n=1 Tax=Geodermatophilus tzadiensis TaxID=1137988 RepID=UPI0011B286F8|nr:glycosyltransferase [Geodermatophilus tzadiensis]
MANQSGRDLALSTSGLPFDVHIVESAGGASRGRNDAINAIGPSVDVMGFPNDDSTYPRTCLEQVAVAFRSDPGIAGLACSLVERGQPRFTLPDNGALDRLTVWRAIEPAMFLRRETLDDVGGFNEALGTGCSTPWQSGEGTDLLLRIIEQGGVVLSRPDIAVIGEGERRDLDPSSLVAKHRGYARGTGYVYRTHPYPFWIRARILAAPWLRLGQIDRSPAFAVRLALARSLGRVEGLTGRTLPTRERTWLPAARSVTPAHDADGGRGSPGSSA